MFCLQCGKPLADGARFCNSCGTPAQAANAAQPQNQTNATQQGWNNTAQQGWNNTAQQNWNNTTTPEWQQNLKSGAAQLTSVGKQLVHEAASSDLAQSSKGTLLQLLKNPSAGLAAAWASPKKGAQLLLGAVNLLVWSILLLNVLDVDFSDFEDALPYLAVTLGLVLPLFCTKLLHATIYHFLSEMKQGFSASFGLVCAGSLYESICVLLLLLLNMVGLATLQVCIVFFMAVVVFGITANYQASILINGNKLASYLVPAVTIIIAFALMHTYVLEIDTFLLKSQHSMWDLLKYALNDLF